MTTTRPRKTLEDYLALPDAVRAELIDGELLVTPAQEWDHQQVAIRLAVRLDDFARERGVGRANAAPLDVRLPTGDIVQPDVVFVSEARRDIVRGHVRGAPDLVAEVVSPAHPERDRLVKRRLYAEAGVAEYWIVDPAERSVQGLRRAPEGDFEEAGWFDGRGTVTSPLLPGFALDVAAFFVEALDG